MVWSSLDQDLVIIELADACFVKEANASCRS